MGWLARQYGLSCDNVVAFEMVTADGEVVRASQTENADLYWGLRGGGGNFGVVTEFEFRLHEVGTSAQITELSFPIDAAGSVLRTWRDLSAEAPRQATFTAGLPSDQNVVAVGFVWVGYPAAGQAVPSMKALGTPLTERVVELSHVDLQRIDDTPQGDGPRRRRQTNHARAAYRRRSRCLCARPVRQYAQRRRCRRGASRISAGEARPTDRAQRQI